MQCFSSVLRFSSPYEPRATTNELTTEVRGRTCHQFFNVENQSHGLWHQTVGVAFSTIYTNIFRRYEPACWVQRRDGECTKKYDQPSSFDWCKLSCTADRTGTTTVVPTRELDSFSFQHPLYLPVVGIFLQLTKEAFNFERSTCCKKCVV